MYFLFGVCFLLFSVGFGYVWGHGSLILLWQPSEFLIILGSGMASIIIANSPSEIIRMLKSLNCFFKAVPYNKQNYLEVIKFFSLVFKKIKAEGVVALEKELEQEEGMLQNIAFIKDPKVKHFIEDALRLLVMGMTDKYHFEEVLETEVGLVKKEVQAPAKIFESLADALPALGIVAAVLGVIVSMKSIAEPPEVLGGLIAAALVGTFSGIFFSYGFFGPMGEYLSKYSHQEIIFLDVVQRGFSAYFSGYSSLILTEIMRKAIPLKVRPTFDEVENYIS